MSQQTLLNQIAELTECQLAPIVQEIDRKGIYPEQFMLNLGKIGGYQSVGTVDEGGNGLGLTAQTRFLCGVNRLAAGTCIKVKMKPLNHAIWRTYYKVKCWLARECQILSNT